MHELNRKEMISKVKLEEIQEEWRKDCRIDQFELVEASENSPTLHAKYSEILNRERLILIAMVREFKRLKLAMRQFMINPSATNPKGFLSTVPKSQRIIKSDYNDLIEGDEVITKEESRVALQQAKVDYLESIMWQIKDRKEIIRNILNTKKFDAGD